MKNDKLYDWQREIISQKYFTDDVLIAPLNSFAARGYKKTGRRILDYLRSPWGGTYIVFDRYTAAQRQKKGAI